MNVLSLFDGMSCGQIALNRANIPYDNYFASEIDKYAIAVTMANYPKTVQLGDVTKIKAKNLPKIDLLIAGSPCFVAGTKILTMSGYKNIEDIIVGDKVLSHTGNWRNVLNIGHTDNTSTRLLKGYGNIGLETTNNHPFYIRTLERKWDGIKRTNYRFFSEPEWIDAENLNKSHYCSMRKINSETSSLDYDFWYMIGRYTGDGWYRKYKRLNRKNSYIYQFIICCGKHEFDELKNCFDKFGHKYSFSEERTGFKFKICGQELVTFVEKIGKGASNKIIHPELFNESVENKKAFLDGLWDSDGNYKKKTNTFQLTTTSYILALGVQQLITDTYNRPVSIEFTKRPPTHIIEGRIVNQKNTYRVSYKNDTRKQDKAFNDNTFSWLPIKYNELTGEKKRVYNLEVEIDNSYTANNVVVHNCQGFSVAGKQLNFDDPRSALFFEFVRLLNELKPKYFLLENVRMKKEWQDIITSYVGVEPIEINSNIFSAQNRKRLYWTNIKVENLPIDKGILIKNITEDGGDKILEDFYRNREIRIYDSKAPTLRSERNGLKVVKSIGLGSILETNVSDAEFLLSEEQIKSNGIEKYRDEKLVKQAVFTERRTEEAKRIRQEYRKLFDRDFCPRRGKELVPRIDDKCNCLTTSLTKEHILLDENYVFRKLTPLECERLQTVDDNYTKVDGVSNIQRYKMLGNGWTVDVISFILQNILQYL